MEKNIRDYLHLYLGCECIVAGTDGTSIITIDGVWKGGVVECNYNDVGESSEFPENIKPILRPLSDMTEEEAIECAKLSEWEPHFRRPTVERTKYGDLVVKWDGAVEGGEQQNVTGDLFWCPDQFQYLLSKHFDLFELIVYDLAIDKTKLSTHAPS